jgi:hypothetical protein
MNNPLRRALFAAPLLAIPAARAAEPVSQEALLAQLHTAAGCPSETAPQRVWCVAADGFATGTRGTLPTTAQPLLGVTVEVEPGRSASDMWATISLSDLAIRGTEGHWTGKITTVRPSDPSEEKAVASAVMGIAAVLKGKAASAPIEKGLFGYLASLPASYPLTEAPNGWTLPGASTAELRRVGDYWVAIESPTAGRPGIFVSIFTDKVTAAP